MLRELTIPPAPAVVDVDIRFEALPDDEAAAILRALAGEMPTGRLKRKAGIGGWLGATLGGVFQRCARAITFVVAPICSTLLNIDTLAIARRLHADPALQRRPRV